MNIHNITSGLTVKNYKELCLLLCEPVKSGKSKQLQIDQWNIYFNHTKSGHSFTITEVYAKPKAKLSKQYGMINQIEELILDLLVQDKNNGKVFLSKHRLFKELNMINDNYNFGRYNVNKLSQLINMNQENVREFYELSTNTLMRSVENALNRLKNRSLVYWQPVKTICTFDTTTNHNDDGQVRVREVYQGINEYQEDVYNYEANYNVRQLHREATEIEVKTILDIERTTMLELGCDNKQELIRYGKWERFSGIVKNEIMDKLNILFYYESYKIIFNEKHIVNLWEEINDPSLTNNERKEIHNDLNNNVQSKLDTNTHKRYEKALESENNKEKTIRRIKDSYITDNEKLIDTLVNRKQKDIRKEIRNVKL